MRSGSDLGSTSTLPLNGTAASSVDPRIGQVLAKRYRILGRIGRGGMGSIYEAEHVLTSKRFAIKTLLPGLDRVGEIARRFEREARASSVMNHPNIVSVSDFGALEDGSLYLAMELVRGRPLGDLIDEGGVAPERAYLMVRQVLEALSHAHGLGIIHRDLKPDNVMVLDDVEGEDADRVKLLDFGIAKVVGETEAMLGGEALTQAGIAFGTPDYMAPEQALGEPVDARADLYAIGVILFELLAGRKPFINEDKMAVLRMQVALDPPLLSEAAAGRAIAAELDTMVARAMAKRRTDRYVDAEDMIRALDAAWAVQRALLAPVPTSPPTTVPPPPPSGAGPGRALPDGGGATARSAPLIEEAPAVGVAPALPAPPPPSLGVRLPPWLTPRLLAIGGGLFVPLVIMIAIAASSGGPAPRPRSGAILVPPRSGGIPQPKTERAKAAEKLLERGQAAQVVASLDEATATPEGARDAWAHLVLGHARIETDKLLEGLAAYDRAVSLEPTLGDDRRLRENAEKLLGKKDKRIAVAAMDLIGRVGVLGHPTILEQASRGKVKELRRRARELAEEKGIDGDVDWVSSWTLDLEQGQTCKERREVVPKLRALRDKRAIPALKKARGRSGGFLGLESVNACLEKDAKEAIEFLEAL